MAKNEKTNSRRRDQSCDKLMGPNLSFGAAEAYKLLRTNLSFGLPDKAGCKVIGVTSALRGEGKSTTAVNIAYTMAQTNQRVLLLEADLRLPTVAEKTRLNKIPGLSNLLAGQCSGKDVLQHSHWMGDLWVIAAGDIPPNPAELVGSEQMETTIRRLSELFDVIVVDLPPVTAVSDALLMSRLVDGMVVVVRQNYCDRGALDEAIRKLRYADAKVLGFVMTDTQTGSKNYRRYGRRYGKDYYDQGYYKKAAEAGKKAQR